jgi:hypothetical protein
LHCAGRRTDLILFDFGQHGLEPSTGFAILGAHFRRVAAAVALEHLLVVAHDFVVMRFDELLGRENVVRADAQDRGDVGVVCSA